MAREEAHKLSTKRQYKAHLGLTFGGMEINYFSLRSAFLPRDKSQPSYISPILFVESRQALAETFAASRSLGPKQSINTLLVSSQWKKSLHCGRYQERVPFLLNEVADSVLHTTILLEFFR